MTPPVEPVHGIQVGEEDDRHGARLPELCQHPERAADGHPPLERLEARPLDRRAVGEGVGEGDPELDHVGARARGLLEEREAPLPARESRADVRNERSLPAGTAGAERLGDPPRWPVPVGADHSLPLTVAPHRPGPGTPVRVIITGPTPSPRGARRGRRPCPRARSGRGPRDRAPQTSSPRPGCRRWRAPSRVPE